VQLDHDAQLVEVFLKLQQETHDLWSQGTARRWILGQLLHCPLVNGSQFGFVGIFGQFLIFLLFLPLLLLKVSLIRSKYLLGQNSA
jgi:hypothetical protein